MQKHLTEIGTVCKHVTNAEHAKWDVRVKRHDMDLCPDICLDLCTGMILRLELFLAAAVPAEGNPDLLVMAHIDMAYMGMSCIVMA